MLQILVIEDEVKVANHLKIGLEEQGYQVEIAYDGEVGLRLFRQRAFDLVLVDGILPGKNGFDLCREIRFTNPEVKIIMLTALGTTDDKVEGLESGADDYIVKPFDFRELIARIKVISRRAHVFESSELRVGDLALDSNKKIATRGAVKIELTAKEYALLEYMMKNKGRVLSRMDITEKVWDLDFDPGTNVVDVYMNILRKKIDKDFGSKLIHTRVGMGYYMDNVD
ncbi:MAG: response regulator transcription factor [Marinoscillum sp.]